MSHGSTPTRSSRVVARLLQLLRPHAALRVAHVQTQARGATVCLNATYSVHQPWQPGEPIDDGRRARYSHTPYQSFPLERPRSQVGAVSCCEEMGESTRRSARREPHAGKSRLAWTASSPKNGPKWIGKGLVDLSTMSNGSTSIHGKRNNIKLTIHLPLRVA